MDLSTDNIKEHFIPPKIKIETEKGTWNFIKNVFNPRTVIKVVHLSNQDFYPMYLEERERCERAEEENRRLFRENLEMREYHMKEKDKLQKRIFELEEDNEHLKRLVDSQLGKYL